MVKRDSQEYEQHLAVQYGFLEVSAKAFDEGRRSEAIRLATVLRTLLHDTDHSTSLMTHLERKEGLLFLDTTGPVYGGHEGGPWTPLIYVRVGGPPVFVPRLLHGARGSAPTGPDEADPAVWLPIEEWMDREVLAEPNGGHRFTARQLIRYLSNKDGGAHVDSVLPESYHAISRRNSLGVRFYELPWGAGHGVSLGDHVGQDEISVDGVSFRYHVGQDAESPVPATVRQLAFEAMWTLHGAFDLPMPTSAFDLDETSLLDHRWPA